MSGLSPQYIMRASLARAVKQKRAEIAARPTDAPESKWDTAEHFEQSGLSEIDNLGWYADYAEWGYSHPGKGILTANWNYFTSDVTDILKRAGYACEWNDEWTNCQECGQLVRTSGDCWDWQPYYVMQECDTICLDCLDREEYLKSIEDNHRTACMAAVNPAEHGYTLINGEYENGWHPGQTDDPKAILDQLQANGEQHLVFRISETSQFYIRFEIWQRQ